MTRRRAIQWLVGGLALTVMAAGLIQTALAPRIVAPAPTAAPTLPPRPFPTATPVPPPGATVDPAAVSTPLPTPPLACQMADNDTTCPRYVNQPDTILSQSGDTLLIVRRQMSGLGCLTICNPHGPAISLLHDHMAMVVPSADNAWLAFTTLDWFKQSESDGGTPALGVYKVRADGSDLTRLDTQHFPHGTVGVNVIRWEPTGDWLDIELWNGSDPWRPYRLKTDGSGLMGPMPSPPAPLPVGEG